MRARCQDRRGEMALTRRTLLVVLGSIALALTGQVQGLD
jgi:hypothetical protein